MRERSIISISLFFVIWYHFTLGEQSPACDSSPRPVPPKARLRQDLLCNYDKLERPVKDYRNTTSIFVNLYVHSIDVVQSNYGNHAEINAWTVLSWKDDFLEWDPSSYNGIDMLPVESSDIWIPDVVHQSPSEFHPVGSTLRTVRCLARQSGFVICAISSLYDTYCVSDMAPWPFDTHKCELLLTAINNSHSNNVDMVFSNRGYYTPDFKANREWQLLGIKAEKVNRRIVQGTNAISLHYEFTIKRHSALYVSTILASALFLSIMTAASFWIKPENSARVGLCCMNVLIQCVYLLHLQYTVGSNGDTCPTIILFYRDSMLLAVISLVASIFALQLSSCSTTPPEWCSRTIHWIIDNRVGQVLLEGTQRNEVSATRSSGDEEASGIVENLETLSAAKYPTDKWIFLVDVMDRIVFYVFVIVFFILLTVRVT